MNDYAWQKVFGSPLKICKWKWSFSQRPELHLLLPCQAKTLRLVHVLCLCASSPHLPSISRPFANVPTWPCPFRLWFGMAYSYRPLCIQQAWPFSQWKEEAGEELPFVEQKEGWWLDLICCNHLWNGLWTCSCISTHIPEGERILILQCKNVIDSCAYCSSVRAEFHALLSWYLILAEIWKLTNVVCNYHFKPCFGIQMTVTDGAWYETVAPLYAACVQRDNRYPEEFMI